MKEAEAALDDLIDTLKKNNIKIIVANIPELRDLKNYKIDVATNFIKNIAINKQVNFIDFHDFLVDQNPESLWVSKEDPHGNAKAFDIMSDAVLKKIKSENLLTR